MSSLMRSVTLAATLLAHAALAHGGEDHGGGAEKHVKGTVDSFAESKLVVKGTDGKLVNVHVDDKTVFENAGVAGKAEDLKVGAKVVVMGEPMKDGTLHATKVRFGKTEKKVAGRKPRKAP